MRLSLSLPIIVSLAAGLVACDDQPENKAETVVRGLKTVVVSASAKTTRRHFPSVVEPADITRLSFEVGGQLTAVDITVGQRVKAGDVLLTIDPKSLQLQYESSQAALVQAESSARNAADDFKRKEELFKKQVIAKATVDQARTTMETSAAQVVQARRQAELAEDNLSKSELKAPFDGVLSNIDVQSFANVAPGSGALGLYKDDAYEVSFSVPFDVVNRIAVGKMAWLRLADDPSTVLTGRVSELGSRADTVSAFPVVVALNDIHPQMKAGMAIEVTLEFPVLGASEGFLMPLSIVSLDAIKASAEGGSSPEGGLADVFVFDDDTSTVQKRRIQIAGVRENSLLVIKGLKEGERVASAGVSFLRDGQTVKLLDTAE
ncbi:efflux RND transporter periplasmic adaptor subunit [Coralliovum pocilloporae]|uniref:efflux RND transporter periplasmic adaptor subunit n=1 Tax=Coralliovum pocilloporae TaxID=3066369 RepID=UPI0033077A21